MFRFRCFPHAGRAPKQTYYGRFVFLLCTFVIVFMSSVSISYNYITSPTGYLSKSRGIIIKLCRRLDMEDMRRKSRVKNGFSAAELEYQSESKVYLNLSLTRETRALWMEARAFKEKMAYKYAWITSAGKVFLRREEGARAIHVTEKADLELLKYTCKYIDCEV